VRLLLAGAYLGTPMSSGTRYPRPDRRNAGPV